MYTMGILMFQNSCFLLHRCAFALGNWFWKPYMDWFERAGDPELHTRVAGRSWEQWRDQQPLRKAFDPAKICHFRLDMEQYLHQDVECLHQIVEAIGMQMAKEYGADIRQKCIQGSLAEHIWMHSLLKKIPKLATEEQHLKWQRVNRGGFCGPLSSFATTAPKGQTIYKHGCDFTLPILRLSHPLHNESRRAEASRGLVHKLPRPPTVWLAHARLRER